MLKHDKILCLEFKPTQILNTMKSILFAMALSLTVIAVKAQIPDGDMETWDNTSGSALTQWSSNGIVLKVTGRTGSAARLESDMQRQNIGAVLFGHAKDNNLGGGFPYSSKPDSFAGYFMYDVKPGDTAFVVLILQKSGIPISMDKYPITGSHTSDFQRISFPISYLAPFIPDTVFLGITSGNPFSNTTYSSYVVVDDVSLPGGSAAVPNGNFDSWNTVSYDLPRGWVAQNDFSAQPVQKTTDKYAGNYAIKIQNISTSTDKRPGLAETTGPHSGQYNNFGPMPAFPVTTKPDTLFCFAKFSPQNGDSATIMVQLFRQGQSVGFSQLFMGPFTNYRLMKLPINYFAGGLNPDSAVIQLAAFQLTKNNTQPHGASVLYVDNLSFDKVITGIPKDEQPLTFYMYPNPAHDRLNFQFEDWRQARAINIMDINGRLVLHQIYCNQVDIGALVKGMYIVTITTDNSTLVQKFVKD